MKTHGYSTGFLPLLPVLLAMAVSSSFSQTFDVLSLEGSAKVQRVQKKDWEKITVGSQLRDNDIVESYFQTKCVLRFGKGNIVIVGSNSKALLNIRERESSPGALISDVNITLFSGACFVKAISQAHISVYTSNAVGETENGAFSTVVESKTGETGFQVLGGNVRTRNIAQKEGITLISGQTTMIFPGKEPTAPLYITYKHVSVLKHFFGEDYIQSELDAAGIKPTEDKTSRSSTLLSDAIGGGQSGNNQDLTTYKIPFSLNKIYGAILSDREKNRRTYVPIDTRDPFETGKFTLGLRSCFAITNGNMYPSIQAIPSYSQGDLHAGLRISMVANYTGNLGLYEFSSASGFLDLVDHVVWAPAEAPFRLAAGPLNDLTIGDGIVVNRFNNADKYAVFQPLGFYGKLALNALFAEAFIADLSQFTLGGVHLGYELSTYYFGAGYFFDVDQYQKIDPKQNNRFRLFPDTVEFKLDSSSMNATIYDVDFSWEAITSEELKVSIGADFAQKFKSTGTEGFVVEVPRVTFDWNQVRLGAALINESGRLIAGQFNSFYASNRWWIDSSDNGDTLLTQSTLLSTKRSCQGLALSFAINPFKGTALEVSLRQNFSEKNSFRSDSVAMGPGTDFSLSLSTNDSLFKKVRYGEIYLRQEHTGLFPPRSSMFSSWQFQAGAVVATHPLLYGIAVDGDISFGFIDMNANNKIDPGDLLLNFSICFIRNFL